MSKTGIVDAWKYIVVDAQHHEQNIRPQPVDLIDIDRKQRAFNEQPVIGISGFTPVFTNSA